jgi:hypothetical protein
MDRLPQKASDRRIRDVLLNSVALRHYAQENASLF